MIFYQLITGKKHPYIVNNENKDFIPKNEIDNTSMIDYEDEFFKKFHENKSTIKYLL